MRVWRCLCEKVKEKEGWVKEEEAACCTEDEGRRPCESSSGCATKENGCGTTAAKVQQRRVTFSPETIDPPRTLVCGVCVSIFQQWGV